MRYMDEMECSCGCEQFFITKVIDEDAGKAIALIADCTVCGREHNLIAKTLEASE